jgi:hypothetical protein
VTSFGLSLNKPQVRVSSNFVQYRNYASLNSDNYEDFKQVPPLALNGPESPSLPWAISNCSKMAICTESAIGWDNFLRWLASPLLKRGSEQSSPGPIRAWTRVRFSQHFSIAVLLDKSLYSAGRPANDGILQIFQPLPLEPKNVGFQIRTAHIPVPPAVLIADKHFKDRHYKVALERVSIFASHAIIFY